MSKVIVRHRVGQGDGEVIACSCGVVAHVSDGDSHVCDPYDQQPFHFLSLGVSRKDAVQDVHDSVLHDSEG